MKRFYGTAVGVSRIISSNGNTKGRVSGHLKNSNYSNNKNNNNNNKFKSRFYGPDAYDLCIKTKAIARSAGAEQALSFALNKLPSSPMRAASSKPVMINTVMTALSREGNKEKFWEVFGAKVDGQKSNWSPQLAATLLNQLAKEMETLPTTPEESGKDEPEISNDIEKFMNKATQIYTEALDTVKVPEHVHLHNAYLKCISRSLNVPYLMWIIDLLVPNRFSDIDAGLFGVKKFIPVDELSLRLVKTIGSVMKRPVELDSHSLTSILSTLSRSPEGSIQLAEAIWSKFELDKSIQLDSSCHLALLLVYRNDLSRIFRQRKLIRSTSWRERKLSRVLEIIESVGGTQLLCSDPKFLSIYFEICFNAKLKERIPLFLQENPNISLANDKRLVDLIKKSQKGNQNAQQEFTNKN
jgi:hypothetical protein